MIKIEFKEAQTMMLYPKTVKFEFTRDIELYRIFSDQNIIKSITAYIPTQDPMLDREHILTQLGITEQEDKLFQEQYKNV